MFFDLRPWLRAAPLFTLFDRKPKPKTLTPSPREAAPGPSSINSIGIRIDKSTTASGKISYADADWLSAAIAIFTINAAPKEGAPNKACSTETVFENDENHESSTPSIGGYEPSSTTGRGDSVSIVIPGSSCFAGSFTT